MHISPKTNKYKGWAGIRRIDFFGALLAAGATVSLVLALTFGGGTPPNGWAWDAWQSYATFGATAGLLVLFLLNEAFLAREPILPLDLFKNQVFAAGALLSIGIGMALYAVALYLPLFIQDVMGKSATESGLLVTPLTLSMAVTAIFGGQLIAKIGRYQWLSLIGTVVMGFGIYLLSQLPANADISQVIRGMVVTGLGLGMVQPVLTLAVQNAIPRIRLGTGTGAVTYLRSMGQLLGIAVVGAVANNVFSSDLATRLPSSVSQLPASARSQLLNPTTLQQVLGDPTLQNQVVQTAQQQADAAVPQIVAQQAPAIIQQQLPNAIAQATANIPPGPDHAAQVAAVTQQVTQQVTASVTHQITATVTSQVNSQVATTLHDLFSASRLSLAVAINQAFFVGVIVCVAIFIVTLFLKDVPLTARAPAAIPAVQATVLREAATFNGEALPPAAFQQAPSGALRLAGGSAAPFVVEPKTAAAAMAANGPTNGPGGAASNLESLESLTWGALGLTLASLAREAESAHADPRLLSALSEVVDGRYPHSWSTEERAQAVARDMVTPLAQALLSAYIGNANPYTPAVTAVSNGATSNGTNGAVHSNGAYGAGTYGAANGAGASYAAALGSNGNGNGATAANGASYPGASYPGASYPGASYPGASYPGASYPGASYPGNGYAPATSYPAASNAVTSNYPGAPNGTYGASGGNSSGTYAQPWAVPSGVEEYPTIVQPRKKVRVTRRLVVDGQVIGEQALEDVVPADADTEAAAAALRARLDSMPQPASAEQSGQWRNGPADSTRRTW